MPLSRVCGRAGLRLAPEQEDLRRFVEAVGSLDGLKVAELLRDKMVSCTSYVIAWLCWCHTALLPRS